jgi:hypothetical protein
MTTINTVLGLVSIAGALLVGVTVLAFVVALWINQPQINKQQLAGPKVCRSACMAVAGPVNGWEGENHELTLADRRDLAREGVEYQR